MYDRSLARHSVHMSTQQSQGNILSDLSTALDQDQRTKVHAALLAWYASHGRHQLPWRHSRDPYAILVAEVMLQQTQVDRVLPKYNAFLQRFPSFTALAATSAGEVIKAWAGLGYNRRAVALWEIAGEVVETYSGHLPGTVEELMSLRGIGRYTAGAVACFAFGSPVATVDTNIRRVLARVFIGTEAGDGPGARLGARETMSLATWALPSDTAYDWQQALMDLGATVCLSRRPLCEVCPLASCCTAYMEASKLALFPSGEALEARRKRRIAEARQGYRATGDALGERGGMAKKAKNPPPFSESSRYFRGKIVAILRELGPGEWISLPELGVRVRPDFAGDPTLPIWLSALLQGLARDGLVRVEGEEEMDEIAPETESQVMQTRRLRVTLP